VSRATRAGTTNPNTGLGRRKTYLGGRTAGRSHTRMSRQARAMARRLLYRNRGLITRWKRTLSLKITAETPSDNHPNGEERTSLSTVQNPYTRLKMYFYNQLKRQQQRIP